MRRARRTPPAAAVAAIVAALLVALLATSAGATGGISGRVTGPDGEPLAGVEVQAFVGPYSSAWYRDMFAKFPSRSGPVAWTQTAADGRYELSGLEATLEPWCDEHSGWYYLLFSPSPATGFTPRLLTGIIDPPPHLLIVEEGKTITNVDVRLGPPGIVAGTVTGPDGTPLANAWVGADKFTSGYPASQLPWRTTTDGLGRYVLTDLEDNAYYVKVTTPGTPAWDLYHPGISAPAAIRPILGAISSGHDIAVPNPGLLQVDPQSSYDYSAWDFSTGFWGLERYWPSPTYLPPGSYRVCLTTYSGYITDTYYPGTFQWEEASPVVIKPGELTSIALASAAPGVARGKVVDGAGTPVEGAIVRTWDDSLCDMQEVTFTDVNGDFSVSSSGDRKLHFNKEGHSSTWLDSKPDGASADIVRFRSGETITLPTVVLQNLGTPGSIAGRVTAGGAPIAGTRVEVWTTPAGATPMRTIVPNADGSYEATALPPDSYLLRFFDSTPGSTFGERWYPAAVSAKTASPVLVEPGLQTGGVDADLGTVGSVAGTLTENGQRLSLSWAKVCLADLLGIPLRCIDTSIAGDTYRFDGVAPGTYLVAFDARQTYSWGRWYPYEDSTATAVPIMVSPGEAVTGIDADFPPEGRIEGQVNLTHGTKGAYLALVEGDSDTVRWYGQWYPSGPFAFRVPPGRYRILASSLGWDFNAHYPQWYPGKTLASEAQIIEVLPGQTVSGIDMLLVSYRYSRPPALTQPPDIAATEGVESVFTLSATDPDGDLLTFGAENLPQGATFDPHSGEFRWIPTCTQAGTYSAIRFVVTDHGRNCGSDPLSAEVTVPVSVTARDCAPVLNPIGGKSVIAGELLTFQITATDPESGSLALEATDLPTGASFNAADGTFTWTPAIQQSGPHTVNFAAVAVADPLLRDSETVTITVAQRNPPVLDPIGDRSITAGETLSFTVTASDPMGDLLVLEATGLPTGASFNAADGTFTWTPGVQQTGAHSVTFAASAVAFPLLRDEETVTITVSQRNPPVLDPIGARSVIVGELLSVTVTAADALGDPVVLEAAGLPDGATFDGANGNFAWRPGLAQAGSHQVTFAAVSTLDGSLRDAEVVTITALGPLLFRDDFTHGDLPADPDWVTLSGTWAVRDGALRAYPQATAIAVPGPGNPAGNNFAAGRIAARLLLGPRLLTTPNLALVFGYRDAQHYRYARFLPGETEIGQVGVIDGQPPTRQRFPRGIDAARWQGVHVDIHPGGTVRAFVGQLPVGAMKFPAAVPGNVGVMSREARAFVDDFRLWSRAVLD